MYLTIAVALVRACMNQPTKNKKNCFAAYDFGIIKMKGKKILRIGKCE